MLTEFNHTNVVLILRKHNQINATEFGPISTH